MHSTIASLRTKLARSAGSLSACVTANRCMDPILAPRLLAGLLVIASASLGSIAHAQGNGTSNLTALGGTFNRPISAMCGTEGAVVHYTTVDFSVTSTGVYTFETTGNVGTLNHVDDPFLVLYAPRFDSAAPATNCLNADDDGGANAESLVSFTLTEGNIYTAVLATSEDGPTGLISWSIAGGGELVSYVSVKKALLSNPTTTSVTLTVQLTAMEYASWVVLPSGAAAPSPTQVVAGLNGLGTPGVVSSNFPVAEPDTDVTAVLPSLEPDTAYDVYVAAYNAGFGSGVRKLTLTTAAVIPPGPTLLSSVPADDAANVAIDTTIVLTFSGAVTFGTGYIDVENDTEVSPLQRIDVAAPDGALAQSVENTVLTITLPTALLFSHAYHVNIEATALIGDDDAPFAGILTPDALNFTTVAADTEPDSFAFAPQIGLPPNSLRTSNAIVVNGIGVPTSISVTNGTFSINGGQPVTSGTVNNGNSVTVYAITAVTLETSVTAMLTVGSVTVPFSVTTGASNPLILANNFYNAQGYCTEGGVRLRLGNDYNDDMLLSVEEIRRTEYVCNGRNAQVSSLPLAQNPLVCPNGGVELTIGVPQISQGNIEPSSPAPPPPSSIVVVNVCNGLDSLLSVDGIESDEDCPNGGIRIATWLDENGDSELSESEDDISQKVCNGLNALVHITTLGPDPAACPRGGTRVLVGTDADGDGALDSNEVTSAENVCNGADGLVDTKALAPDVEECPTGGIQVDSGTDTNGDGSLDGDEISKSRKLCNAIATVSRTTKLTPGANVCPYGGSRFESGLDADGDHQLDDREVSSSALVCNGTNLAIRTVELEVGSEECPAGGSVLETGIDTDGDSELGDSEVLKRQVLCQPPQLLFETTTIDAEDETCPHGGLRVTSGHDDGQPEGTAGDGLLQAGEVELDKSICLAPTDVLVSGGSGSCTVTPGHRGSTGLLWSALLGLLGVSARRRRRVLSRNN